MKAIQRMPAGRTLVAVTLLVTASFVLSGCSDVTLQNQVENLTQQQAVLQNQTQTLAQDKADLQKQIETLKQEKAALEKQTLAAQSIIRIDRIETAVSVNTTGGQTDWRKYTAQKSFPSGYKNGLWVVFNFSNMLHDKNVNVTANIFLVSDGEVRAVKNKTASLTDAADNTLWWGDFFDISAFPDGEYTAILTVNDVIAKTTAAQMTTFIIGAAK